MHLYNFKTITSLIALISASIITILFCLSTSMVEAKLYNETGNQIKTIGAWAPLQPNLEYINDSSKQKSQINNLLSEGINEYYLIMHDLDKISINKTEDFLKTADLTPINVLIILLPPSEGGKNGNYDWQGWMNYFNSLKSMHKSFKGFVIDDFNANYIVYGKKFQNNVEYMNSSNLLSALSHKSQSISFYPVLYIESGSIAAVKRIYGNFISGIILSSTIPERITNLEENIKLISTFFDKKPVKYIVYPFRDNISKPLDNNILKSTLFIASRTADGIIIYVDVTNPVIQYYLHNRSNSDYLFIIKETEKARLKQENDMFLKERRDIYICTSCLNGNFHIIK